MKRSLFVFAILPAAVVMSGCPGNPTEPPTPPPMPRPTATPTPQAQNGLVVTASSPQQTWKAGEPVELRLSVQNTSKKPIELQFTSGQSFDFQAFKPGSNDAVWTWSMDKLFMQALRQQTLQPGEKLDLKGEWQNPPAGTFEIEGTLTANGGVKAPRFTIEVK